MITLKQWGNGTANNASSVTLTFAQAPATGDLIWAAVRSATYAVSTPSGWTAGPSTSYNGGLLYTFYRLAPAGAPNTYAFSYASIVATCWVIGATFGGVDQTTPLDVAGVSYTGTASTHNLGSVTTTRRNCLIVDVGLIVSASNDITQPAGINYGTSISAPGVLKSFYFIAATLTLRNGIRTICRSEETSDKGKPD